MDRALRVFITLPAILFLVMGLRWIADPGGASAALGMPLLDGLGRSSQIGDVGALFLCMGLMIFIGLITSTRSWFLAPALLLAAIACFRILAWLFHGAPLAPQMIVVEVVVACLLLVTSSRLDTSNLGKAE